MYIYIYIYIYMYTHTHFLWQLLETKCRVSEYGASFAGWVPGVGWNQGTNAQLKGIYMYIYIHVCVCIYINGTKVLTRSSKVYICICVYIYTCVCVYLYKWNQGTNAQLKGIYMYICIYVNIYVCVYLYKCIYICIYTYVYIYIYSYIYIHIWGVEPRRNTQLNGIMNIWHLWNTSIKFWVYGYIALFAGWIRGAGCN